MRSMPWLPPEIRFEECRSNPILLKLDRVNHAKTLESASRIVSIDSQESLMDFANEPIILSFIFRKFRRDQFRVRAHIVNSR